LREDDEEVEKLAERDVAVVVLVDHLEHVRHEHRVRLKSERVGELGLGQLARDIVDTARRAVQRLARVALVVLQRLQAVVN